MTTTITRSDAAARYANSETVYIKPDRVIRGTTIVKKYADKPIPMGKDFAHYVREFIFWTNSKPIFYIVE